jgi:hypothetical protein
MQIVDLELVGMVHWNTIVMMVMVDQTNCTMTLKWFKSSVRFDYRFRVFLPVGSFSINWSSKCQIA